MSYPIYLEFVDLMVVALHVNLSRVGSTNVCGTLKHIIFLLLKLLYENVGQAPSVYVERNVLLTLGRIFMNIVHIPQQCAHIGPS